MFIPKLNFPPNKLAMSPLSIENHQEQNVTISLVLNCGSDPLPCTTPNN